MVNQFFLWYNCFQYGMIRHYFLKGRCYHDSWTDRLFLSVQLSPGLFLMLQKLCISPSPPFPSRSWNWKKNWSLPYGTAASVLLCLLLKESFFTKKHLRFPDSIIVLWKQCTIFKDSKLQALHIGTLPFSFSVPSYFCDTQFLWYTPGAFFFLWRR